MYPQIYFSCLCVIYCTRFIQRPSRGEIDPNVIKNLLANFKIAFQTTIWGIIASSFSIAKLLQIYISQMRDRFRYSLVLLIKNLIVPKYAIQEADEKILEKCFVLYLNLRLSLRKRL